MDDAIIVPRLAGQSAPVRALRTAEPRKANRGGQRTAAGVRRSWANVTGGSGLSYRTRHESIRRVDACPARVAASRTSRPRTSGVPLEGNMRQCRWHGRFHRHATTVSIGFRECRQYPARDRVWHVGRGMSRPDRTMHGCARLRLYSPIWQGTMRHGCGYGAGGFCACKTAFKVGAGKESPAGTSVMSPRLPACTDSESMCR